MSSTFEGLIKLRHHEIPGIAQIQIDPWLFLQNSSVPIFHSPTDPNQL